jgi:hypothetical protein
MIVERVFLGIKKEGQARWLVLLGEFKFEYDAGGY